jgi:hypothetical protein
MIRLTADSAELMFAAGLLLRLIVCGFCYPHHLSPARNHWQFGYEMGRVARSIWQGNGFSSPLDDATGPTAFYAPIYPYLIALCLKISGGVNPASSVAILSLNSVFSAGTVFPICRLADILFGRKTARYAGWTWAFYPYGIDFSANRIWENALACLLFSCALLQTVQLWQRWRNQKSALWGATWGVAALVSPSLVAPFPILAAWLGLRKPRRQNALRILIPASMFLITIAPWSYRNYRVFHRLIPLRDNFWLEVHVGNNGDLSDVTPDSGLLSHNHLEYGRFKTLGETGYMAAKRAEYLGKAQAHPWFFLRMIFRHFLYHWTGFWSFDREFLMKEPFEIQNMAVSCSMLCLMLVGIRRAARRHLLGSCAPLLIALAIYPAVYYVTHSSPEYRHPMDPIAIVFGCFAIACRREPVAAVTQPE